ncbi:HD domain-containing protein [Desulfomicrobium escambiense]|uniref:HD domain-containing protein n=1 Tax=Desulfomicrobium escambiense TaxID=29503 RepID=UPI0004915C2D|nr:HD domain-containing protein [Desulfomicrobium escambiense]
MASIRKGLLQLVFSGSFMKRWNDKMRPMELVEVDKQAHKMIAAWLLFELNSQGMSPEEKSALGEDIVRGGIFDYLYRLVITDIKPPIFYQIKANPAHYEKLTAWVLNELQPRVQPLGKDFWDAMRTHFERQVRRDESLASRILDAAHLFASRWEFHLIRDLNQWDEEMDEIEENFRQGLEAHLDLAGVRQLLEGPGTRLGKFAFMCGRLRFQKRWSQTPRIPETSVLGHMFIVACLAYFFSIAVGACPVRRHNNFFAGLFHDIPELLTRDIISPVKSSVQGIGDLIREYEGKEIEQRLFSILDRSVYTDLVERLSYFLGIEVGSEFEATILQDGAARVVGWEQLQGQYNEDRFCPKDGRMLKICDHLAAFLEAYTALSNGITNAHLQQASWRIRNLYQNQSLTDELHIGALLADFD